MASSIILSETKNIRDSIEKVLTQAFEIELDEERLSEAVITIQAVLTSVK